MWVFGREDLRFIAVNDAAISLYGYSREQFLAMTALDIRPPEERDRFRRVVGTGLGASREALYRGRFWRHVKADGTLIDVAIFAQNLTYEGRSAVPRQRSISRNEISPRRSSGRRKSSWTQSSKTCPPPSSLRTQTICAT